MAEENLLPDDALDRIASALWDRMTGDRVSGVDLQLRAKLALEQRLLPTDRPPFGLDRLDTPETATYVGVQVETLRDKNKRRQLGLPQPFHIGRKLFWRRSEIDQWIEQQREQSSLTETAKTAAAK